MIARFFAWVDDNQDAIMVTSFAGLLITVTVGIGLLLTAMSLSILWGGE